MKPLQLHHFVFPALALLALSGCQQAAADADAAAPAAGVAATAAGQSDAALLAQGDYLVRIAGCNDCHTPGYAETAGAVPREQWLVGSPLGWNGPWGTTYPANLRLKLQDMDEAAWMKYSGELHTRPPMPDFAVRAMTENDRRAIYRFIRALGPAGQAAPAYLPPGQKPPLPYVQWVLPPGPPPQAPAAG
jgi:mono/diheme cytochrome c family protein